MMTNKLAISLLAVTLSASVLLSVGATADAPLPPGISTVVETAKAAGALIELLGKLDKGNNRLAFVVTNETDETLRFDEDSLGHGKWEVSPPSSIPPGKSGLFVGRDKENSVLTGFEGMVVYTGGSRFQCFLFGDNPQFGSNKSHAAIAGPRSWTKGKYDEYRKGLREGGGTHQWTSGGFEIVRTCGGEEIRFIIRTIAQ